MGLSLSWIATKGAARSDVLGVLGLAAEGEPFSSDPVPAPSDFAAFEWNGWVFVISSNCAFADRERIRAASQDSVAVGAYLEEHVMASGAFGAAGGELTWSVQHDSELGLEHLETWGDPPEALATIHATLLKELLSDDEVDFIFDVPVELAASVCGFNPNTFNRSVELQELSVVQGELMKLVDQPLPSQMHRSEAAKPEAPAKPGFFSRLFGRHR
jgi:hypothetical protein